MSSNRIRRLLLDRREFLKLSAFAAVGAAAGPALSSVPRRPFQDEDLRVAVIGVRGQGASHRTAVERAQGARVVAVCDVDRTILDREIKHFADKGEKIFTTQDMRDIFDRNDIDAVTIATPNHWHSLATIWACQAGKHVYVEKPVSHSVWEGRRMVEAARKYNKVVQAGLQNRSDTGARALTEWLREGGLGAVRWAHTFWYRVREGIGKVDAPTPIPDHVDYDLFCGPRDVLPLMRKNLHYDWHWQWACGNGELGNSGVHVLDDARHLLHLDVPNRIMHAGDRYLWKDDGETPNVSFVAMEFGELPLIFEVRDFPDKPGSNNPYTVRGESGRTLVVCENGYCMGGRGGGGAYDNDGKRIKEFPGDGGATHMQNFVDAVRNNKPETLRCPIEEGHKSSMICHFASIAHRLGRRATADEVRETLGDMAPAVETFNTIPGHLALHGIGPDAGFRLGDWLTVDTAQERFTGGPNMREANGMLREAYRHPFVVPDKV